MASPNNSLFFAHGSSITCTRSVINAMAAGLMAVDATCMALLAISASRWDGTAAAARVDSAVMLLQLLALCGESWDWEFAFRLGDVTLTPGVRELHRNSNLMLL